jgi:hypothetical protein
MPGESWDFAEQLSDKIVDLVRADIAARPDFSPIDLLAGQVLALRALLNTAEGLPVHPPSLVRLRQAVDYLLGALWRQWPDGPPRKPPVKPAPLLSPGAGSGSNRGRHDA